MKYIIAYFKNYQLPPAVHERKEIKNLIPSSTTLSFDESKKIALSVESGENEVSKVDKKDFFFRF